MYIVVWLTQASSHRPFGKLINAFKESLLFSTTKARLIQQETGRRVSFPKIARQILSRTNFGTLLRRSLKHCLKDLPGGRTILSFQ